jgi:sporulation protein YlmC with PRC-barrel domain
MAGTNRDPNEKLAPIGDTDFKVASEDPDPRGWHVLSADGRRVGKIDDLIVDQQAAKVRYLVCDLDEDELGIKEDRDRHVLIPVGFARLIEKEKRVVVDTISSEDVATMPVPKNCFQNRLTATLAVSG